MARAMSDTEIRRRKKAQGHISQVTGGLGLAALGGTLAASRGGRNTLRKVPQLKSRIKAPPPKDPNRDKIKSATVPILATSAGLGGAGSFNFAAYTNAESRKRKQMSKRLDDWGYFGDEGTPVSPVEIEAEVEKAWSPAASNFDSERSRQKRNKAYEGATLVGAGGAGAYAAHQGTKAVKAAKKIEKPKTMAEVHTRTNSAGNKYKIALGSQGKKAIPTKHLGQALKHGGKAAAGVAAVGGAAALHGHLKRKQAGSWSPYAKRNTTSAFGIDHE